MTTLTDLRRWAAQAAALDATVPASKLAEILDAIEDPERVTTLDQTSVETWAEKLWRVPAETRLGVNEAAEALRRPRSFIYARTGGKADDPLPHRKLDGSLVFTAGELRAWIRDREEVVAAGPYLSVANGGAS